LQAFIQNILSVLDVCCKRFLSRCCTCFTPMLQKYIQNVSVISVLCCNKCFHVAICKCFFDVTCVSHTHVAIVCSKYFICFSRMLHPSVSCFRGRESWEARPGRRGWGSSSRGPTVRTCNAPRILRTGRAHPHAISQVPPAQR
jgi:hypothetical protein